MKNYLFGSNSILSLSMINQRVLIILFFIVSRFGMNIVLRNSLRIYRVILDVRSTGGGKERGDLISPRSSIRDARARFAHAWLSVPSGTAGLLPAKWTIRNDTGGCHFSAKCCALSAGDDGSRLYIFFLSISLFFSRPLSFSPSHVRIANVLEEKAAAPNTATCNLARQY